MKKYLVLFYLFYLKIFAKIQLKKINPIVIGIGGATGKTSLSELTYQILKNKYRVKESKGFNSETGIPLNLLGIEMKNYGFLDWLRVVFLVPIKIVTNWEKYDIYVVEMGIDSPHSPKNMSYLLGIIKPNISVLTNIQIEHSKYFDELADSSDQDVRKKELLNLISNQEKLLITSVNKSGKVIINLDDEKISESLPLEGGVISVSAKDSNADFHITKIEVKKDLFRLHFSFLNENYVISLDQALPRYYSYIFIFSIAIAFLNEISIKESIDYLESSFRLPPGRFTTFKGKNKSIVFDSSYNSSLEASIGAIEVLNEVAGKNKKIGIFGDMRELGEISKLQHELLAKEMIRELNFAVLIGDQINEYSAPLLKKANFKFRSFRNFTESRLYISDLPSKNDFFLVKSSQNTFFLERAVEVLLENKKDRERLCRRGEYWDEMRRNTL